MIQCIIFKFRKWHICNYEWYRLHRSYENCRRPGVAILDMQMSKVPIISGYAFFVCICFVMAPKSRYLKSVNHKIVTWNTNRPRILYFTIFFNLLFLYFPIFSLNCICCHLFSADNISIFTYNFIHIQFHVIYIKSYILPTNIPAKNLEIV